jgi:hypothetical protein
MDSVRHKFIDLHLDTDKYMSVQTPVPVYNIEYMIICYYRLERHIQLIPSIWEILFDAHLW